MSVTYLGELLDKRHAGSQGTNINASRTFAFRATESEHPVTALQASELPKEGEALPGNSNFVVVSHRFKDASTDPASNVRLIEVTCDYSKPNASVSTSGQSSTEYPWDLPPDDIHLYTIPYEQVMDRGYDDGDENGYPTIPVLSSAKMPFDPAANKIIRSLAFSFTYNARKFGFDWPEEYCDTVNFMPETVLGKKIGTKNGKINDINSEYIRVAETSNRAAYAYWQIKIEIEVSKYTFYKHIQDAAFFFLDGGKQYRIHYKDGSFGKKSTLGDDSVPVDEPRLLNGEGGLLALGLTPVYKSFQPYFPARWGPLGLPKELN